VPISEQHHFEHAADELVRYLRVKEVAHTVDEDHPGSLIFERFEKPFGPQTDRKRIQDVCRRGDHRQPSGVVVFQ
jgi:hypothetical protein